jgi:hypothetical protein
MVYDYYFADYDIALGYHDAGSDDDDDGEEEREKEEIASENEEEEPDEHEKPIVERYRAPLPRYKLPHNWVEASPYRDELVINQRGKLHPGFSTLSRASRQIFAETWSYVYEGDIKFVVHINNFKAPVLF